MVKELSASRATMENRGFVASAVSKACLAAWVTKAMMAHKVFVVHKAITECKVFNQSVVTRAIAVYKATEAAKATLVVTDRKAFVARLDRKATMASKDTVGRKGFEQSAACKAIWAVKACPA